ncbi:MAG: hypothetical protein H0W08_14575 [Acidobacteria bacterium]|nr:hypothetical protein [Acidobacteriota bacterium]
MIERLMDRAVRRGPSHFDPAWLADSSVWALSNKRADAAPRVISINSTGVATGVARGEAVVMVRYQSQGAGTRTFVLPPDTYRLSGTVLDSKFGLAGVSVTIIVAAHRFEMVRR